MSTTVASPPTPRPSNAMAHCPRCESRAVGARSVRVQGQRLYIGMRCVACSHQWTETRDEPSSLSWRTYAMREYTPTSRP